MHHRCRLIAVLMVALAATACGTDDDTTENTTVATAAARGTTAPVDTAPGAATVASGTGLQVVAVVFETSTALVVNQGPDPMDLTDLWVCNRPGYDRLPPVELAPGEGVEVDVPGLRAEGGEVALYSTNNFGDSGAILSYVQWGGGGGRAAVAESAGIWSGDPVEVTGDRLDLVGPPGSSDGWS